MENNKKIQKDWKELKDYIDTILDLNSPYVKSLSKDIKKRMLKIEKELGIKEGGGNIQDMVFRLCYSKLWDGFKDFQSKLGVDLEEGGTPTISYDEWERKIFNSCFLREKVHAVFFFNERLYNEYRDWVYFAPPNCDFIQVKTENNHIFKLIPVKYDGIKCILNNDMLSR